MYVMNYITYSIQKICQRLLVFMKTLILTNMFEIYVLTLFSFKSIIMVTEGDQFLIH